MNFIKTFFSREILVYSKKSSNIISPIVFFLICITFFPLAVSNDPMGAEFANQTYLVNEREAVRIAKMCKAGNKKVRFILAL